MAALSFDDLIPETPGANPAAPEQGAAALSFDDLVPVSPAKPRAQYAPEELAQIAASEGMPAVPELTAEQSRQGLRDIAAAPSLIARQAARGVTDMAASSLKAAAIPNVSSNDAAHAPFGVPSLPVSDEAQAAIDQINATPVQERSLYKAGATVDQFAKDYIPTTPEEDDSILGRVARMGGSVGPIVGLGIANPALGLTVGAGLFGASAAGAKFDEAKTKGASDEDATAAAGLSGAVGTALGVLPLGAVLAPIRRLAPSMEGWVLTKLAQAGRSGLTFAGIGEVQHYIEQQIAAAYYDPDAHYEPEQKRILASLIGGGLLGAVHPIHEPRSSRAEINDFIDLANATKPGAADRAKVYGEAVNVAAGGNYDQPRLPPPSPAAPAAEAAAAQGARPTQAPPEGAIPAETILPQEAALGPAPPPFGQDVSRETPQDPAGRHTLKAMLDDPRSAEEMRTDLERAKSDAQAALNWRPTEDWQELPAALASSREPVRFFTGQGEVQIELKTENGKTIARIAPPQGSRERPVALYTPGDVSLGAERTAQPTPAQAEAGNYSKRHIEWNGLEGAIETEAGGERTGIGPDGKPWSTTLQHPYGYFKDTTGKDGDELDFYLGPNPASPRAFVFDQADPDSRKFDEHKIVIGAKDEAEAIAIYEHGFSDGSGPLRWGSITAMSPAELKTWIEQGDTKKPLAYKPTPKARAAPKRGPLSLFQFLAKNGGIQDHGGELRAMDLHRVFVPGFGRLVRATGRPLDQAREAAVEAGYLNDAGDATGDATGGVSESTINDLLDALARGQKLYSQHDIVEVQDPEAAKQAKESATHIKEREAEVRDLAQTHGFNASDAQVQEAARASLVNDADPIDALVDILERDAIAEHDDLTETVRRQGATDGEARPTAADENGARPAPAVQPAGPAREAPAGSAPPRVEPREDQRSRDDARAEAAEGTRSPEGNRGPEAAGAAETTGAAEAVAAQAPKPPTKPATNIPRNIPEVAKAPETGPSDSGDIALARALLDRLNNGQPITAKILQDEATKAHGGTLAEGKFDRKDAQDALELAVNMHIKETRHLRVDSPNPAHAIKMLGDLLDGLPTQRVRSEEQQSFQQFSTPPAYAAAAAYAANLRAGDTMLEPSAGTGSLVAAASAPGVAIYANELSPRRTALLRELVGKDGKVFTENAEQIDNILDVKPTVVLMNPPFSQTAGRMGDKKVIQTAAVHIEAALNLLQPGGRLVAIVGRGMTMGAPTFRAWWGKIGEKNAIRANIGVDGAVFEKYGTTFGTRVIVIDKVQPVPGEKPVLVDAQTVDDLMRALEPIRNGRSEQQTAGAAAEQPAARPRGADMAEGAGGQALPQSPATGGAGIGAGRDGRVAGGQPSSASGTGESAVRVEGGERVGVADLKPEQRGSLGAGREPVASPANGGQPTERGGARSERDLQPAGGRQSGAATGSERVELETAAPGTQAATGEINESLYQTYEPARVRVKGAQPHPGALVESASMSSVEPPATDYKPSLPKKVIEKGLLSLAQLEPVIYAGRAHAAMLPAADNETPQRRGFFIGDGTGVGKGREIAGIILDNWNHGRTKAVWVTEKQKLLNDAKRDWTGLEQNPAVIFNAGKTKTGEPISAERGIAFITYDTLKGGMSDQAAIARGAFVRKQQVTVNGQSGAVQRIEPGRRGEPTQITVKLDNGTEVTVPGNEVTAGQAMVVKSRVDQLVDWFGKDFDGVVAFDESHNMGNATSSKGERGDKNAAQKALAGLELQRRLPNARIVYVSATGATEVSNLAYAERLGLWGRGTAFASQSKFVAEVESGGIAAMEIIARDMKQLGLYTARNLSYDGVEYDRVEHKLDANQHEIYDTLAEAWQNVLRNINAALEETGGDKDARAKSAAMSAFWGGHQRFFNQIITSMQMPSVIKAVEADLAAGRQAVLQLTNTNEASQERAAAKAKTAEDIEDLDITPRDQIIQLVERSFPTQEYEIYVDQDGKERSRPVVDSQGNPVQNKQAVAMKETLIDRLASVRVPQGPLDMILDHFGVESVSEVTGRGRRFVLKPDEKTGERRRQEESRPGSANQSEIDTFQAGKKKILVFSEAGGTGASYHADNTTPSKDARRAHYLVQGGWRADKAVQGFGRTHRTNQASAPIVRLVTTDLQGQKRFISSIARRLAQLGALTKGQRQAGDQGIFSARDNLESTEAHHALRQFYSDLLHDAIPGVEIADFEAQTGLKLRTQDEEGRVTGVKEDLPPITQFLNRLLSLKVDMQNHVFDAFSERLDRVIEARQAAGLLDVGLETVKADKIVKDSERTVHTVEESKAETKHVKFTVSDKFNPIPFKRVADDKKRQVKFWAISPKERVYAVAEAASMTNEKGAIVDYYRLINPVSGSHIIERSHVDNGEKWSKIDRSRAEEMWQHETDKAPEFLSRDLHLITGAILPIWDRLGGSTRVVRLRTDSGEHYIGRVVPRSALAQTLKKLGAESEAAEHTPKSVFDAVMAGGRATLTNGWTLSRRLVAGEHRIELKGPSSFSEGNEVKADGVFTERINYELRYFVPTDAEAGERVLGKLTKYRQVVDLSERGTSPTDVAAGDEPMFAMQRIEPDIGDEPSLIAPAPKQRGLGRPSEAPQGGAIPAYELRTPYTAEFQEHGDKVAPLLRAELDRLGLPDIALRLPDRINLWVRGQHSGADGIYWKRTITLALDADSKFKTLHHEALHALRDLGLFTKAEWGLLERQSQAKWREQYEIERFYPDAWERIKTEEGIASAYAEWASGNSKADGRFVRLFKRIRSFFESLGNALRGAGFKTVEDIFQNIKSGKIGERTNVRHQGREPMLAARRDSDLFKTEIGADGKPQTIIPGTEKISEKERVQREANKPLKPGKIQKDVDGLPLFNDEPSPELPLFALKKEPESAGDRQRASQGFMARGQFIDRAIRMPFDIFGGTTKDGEWKPGHKLFEGAAKIITGASFKPDGRFSFLNPIMETARSGLVDRYNLRDMPDYVERERGRALDERAKLMQANEILKAMDRANVGLEEARVLHAIITEGKIASADMAALAEPIQAAIDQWGQEAVALGLVSAESFERNRGTYMHRVFQKYELEQYGLQRMVNGIMGARRKKIIGNQYKGRGTFNEIELPRLMRDVPDWHEGARGKPENGEKFVRLDEMAPQQQFALDENRTPEKVLRTVYLPADQAIPDRYAAFRNQGIWEVRGTKNGKIVLWRDLTKEERTKLGEILDARYTFAKTAMLSAHDLSVGKFYKDISQNEDWASSTPPEGRIIDAAEWQAGRRAYKPKEHDWVRAPETEIGSTGGKKRWGALAGKWVREEIWRDLNEIDIMSRPNTWRALLTQWKLNKTARSPVVHMNNVMSNFVLMDMMDVRMQDLAQGVRSYASGDTHYKEAFENGAFGADMITQEVRDQVLKPILEELQKGNTFQQGGRLGLLGQVSRFTGLLHAKYKIADQFLKNAYRIEDEVFRMATYIRRRQLGDDPKQAATVAREQFIDYDIRAPWINAARNTVLPFISYTYRAIPLVAKAVATRPWKIAKYAMLAYLANALAYAVTGGDEDKERGSLDEKEQGHTWVGAHRMTRMPMSDRHGNPIFLDIRRWMPAGDVFDFNQGQSPLPIPSFLNMGGPLLLGAELFLNKQAFTGQPITNEKIDDPWDKTGKIADWAYKSWMPSAAYIPGSWYWEKISNAAKGATDRQGRPYDIGLATASSIGIKLKPQDVEDGYARKGQEFSAIERELEAEAKRISSRHQRGIISESTFNRAMQDILSKQEKLAKKAGETFK